MTDLTEQEKLERRRQKRQQKILASAEKRLSRITGTAFAHISPTPSPSTSASSLVQPDKQSYNGSRSRSPSPAVFNHSNEMHSQLPKQNDLREELGPPPSMDQPMFDFLVTPPPNDTAVPPVDLQQFLNAASFPFNPALFSSFARTHPLAEKVRPDRYWALIHFVSMVWLGLYAVYHEWSVVGMTRFRDLMAQPIGHATNHFPMFWYFITLELLIHSARMLYQKDTPKRPIWDGLVQQLPPPLANAVNVLIRYRLIGSSLIQDSSVLVFIIGVAQVISAIVT